DMRTAERLKEMAYESVETVEAADIGVAFSGGVDSSLLAKACKDVDKNVTLLTVGFSSQRDIRVSSEVAEALSLRLFHDLIGLEELENGLKTVLAAIDFDRFVRLENCVCFHYVFRLASKRGLSTVVSANGIDELFCGYHVYREQFGDETATENLMRNLLETARKDKKEMDKLSALFNIEYICPFLSERFVDFAMQIPLNLKIKSRDDDVRKHVLREAALEAGVPRPAALRAKKAFQYSSGIHKAIIRLAREKGFTKKEARAEGFRSEMEAYINSVREITEELQSSQNR
ncbi:MAG: asparagine synthase C-terminal domain-containing protein, partial [Candidatus Bathyarchaeota archaeon]|nr:asparagine synthase C-terminal domain-containing protein [Candidatus Bathyarchaeota archaeon]